MARRKLIQLHY